MSWTTRERTAALAKVSRLLLAAQRQGQNRIDVRELALALKGLDVEALAEPRHAQVGGLGRRPSAAARASSLDGEKVAWS